MPLPSAARTPDTETKDTYMAVSKRLRYEILRRDNHTCRYCGAGAPDVPLRVDHVVPVALGGSDVPDNLVTSCEPCNSGKSSATVDSTVVATVADDALRWAEAMKQAAADLAEQQKPKHEYRAIFQKAWNEWKWEHRGQTKNFDLPDGWKTSLDNFREAGLPQEVWPDIIEKAMTNKTVKADSIFRYCCGIAWRMVRELQDRAKAITGAAPKPAVPLDAVVAAAVEVWASELGEDADEETRQHILTSAQLAREQGSDAHRILEAAQYAAWFGMSSVRDAMAQLQHDSVMHKWRFAWLTATGDYPDDARTAHVRGQVDALLAADVYVGRLDRAAEYAGSRRSARLYFGLSEEELAVTGDSETLIKAVETWSEAFQSAAGRWPTKEEVAPFFESLRRIGNDGDIWISDIFPAAAAAGAYQDPDMSTCLTRHLSVFEAAARPLAPSA